MHLSYGLQLPNDARHVPVVRRLTASTLTELGAEPDCVADVELAVTEACSNVVRHASSGSGFSVGVTVEGSTCTIEVVDAGGGLVEALADADGADSADSADGSDGGAALLTSGRGIDLMRLLVDQLHFSPSAGGTTVVLVKELRLRDGSVLAEEQPAP